MKLFAVLVLTLVAQIYTSSGANINDFDIFSRMIRPYKSNASPESSSEERPNYRSNQMELFTDLEDTLQGTRATGPLQFQSSASRMPQAQSFKTKVYHRLEGSTPLSNNPDLKKKLIKLADQKLENCKTPSGQELDRHCVGRATGQIMQLIASVENANNAMPWESQRHRLQQFQQYN